MRTAIFLLAVGSLWGIEKAAPTPPPPDPVGDPAAQLLNIRRIFVDRLSGGPTAEQIRDMLIAAIQSSKLFVITENEERADAFLRGSAEDLVFTDVFSSSDSIDARASSGSSSSSGESSGGSYDHFGSNRASGRSGSLGVGENESSHTQERKHEAVAAVRLVDKDGDVIWSSTQESLGGKFRGSSADVADKITKQLVSEYNRVKKAGAIPPLAPSRPPIPQAASTGPSAKK